MYTRNQLWSRKTAVVNLQDRGRCNRFANDMTNQQLTKENGLVFLLFSLHLYLDMILISARARKVTRILENQAYALPVIFTLTPHDGQRSFSGIDEQGN